MPELFDHDAMFKLQEQARMITLAISELVEHRKYGERFNPAEKAKLMASIKANALAGGVDLGEWQGRSNRGGG